MKMSRRSISSLPAPRHGDNQLPRVVGAPGRSNSLDGRVDAAASQSRDASMRRAQQAALSWCTVKKRRTAKAFAQAHDWVGWEGSAPLKGAEQQRRLPKVCGSKLLKPTSKSHKGPWHTCRILNYQTWLADKSLQKFQQNQEELGPQPKQTFSGRAVRAVSVTVWKWDLVLPTQRDAYVYQSGYRSRFCQSR